MGRLGALLVCAAWAGSSAAAAPEPLALVGGNVVGVRDGRIQAGVTLLLRDGRIESIGTARHPPAVRVLQLRGRYVLPGLIDAHTHVSNFARRGWRWSRA
jgi:imidazolonepropionase-like amidohydrolase